MKKTKIGIIICHRYHSCAGGKCFRALREREGAFKRYSKEEDVEIVGYTSCGGCPGGNVEYAPEEMIKNGAEVIHLATGLVVGYPPCPRIDQFKKYIETRYRIPVVIGTHPIPEKYQLVHDELGTWKSEHWQEMLSSLKDPLEIRKAYD
ncbi:MAG: CGGC domain-containing protein [Candidatus Marinimicrobia bacterium]|nr:CGGC domain-containing protein [Candidatus Neomarinimicrobiota bacterium]